MENIEGMIRVDGDVRRKVLSDFSLECIRTRFSNSKEVPPLNPDGFRRISNPLNWPIISNKGIKPRTEPDATPLILKIPDDLHSVQTLQFLDFTLPEHKDANSRLGLAELAKAYIDATKTMAESFVGAEGQPMDNIAKVVTLTQDFMGFDLDGDRLEIIDQLERPLVLSTVKDWVIEALERRYKFLCKSDSAIVRMEMTYRRLEEDEAIRKARNRKKAEAKKALKQKRKTLKDVRADEVQAEGDDQRRLLDQVQFANDAEEKRGAPASKDSKGAENPPKI